MEILQNVALMPHTTFQIGGAARYFCAAESAADIKEAYRFAAKEGLPVAVLGGGSNMLVPDDGLDALVLQIKIKGMSIRATALACAAGEPLFGLVTYAASQGLGGLEGLSGVPGTVGGAVRGNAGAFGTEIKDVLQSVRALDTDTDDEKVYASAECGFAYRSSRFKQNPRLIILEATFALASADPSQSDAKIMHMLAERTRRHIQDIKSAGSFFKNPVVSAELQEIFKQDKGAESKEGRVPAGWLMDRAGLKGARAGDAVSSPYHTNYFLNEGHATAAQVKELAALAKEKVFEKFGVMLEEEAVVL